MGDMQKEDTYQSGNDSNENCIIFNSDMWHRVRPVKSGVRKSIVWLLDKDEMKISKINEVYLQLRGR